MRHLLGITILTILFSCQSQQKGKNDKLVADINGKELYLSQLNIPSLQTNADSISYINAKAEEWVRTEILLAEAKKGTRTDQQIENLVSDYKKNLILAKFEKNYVEENLDTVISIPQIDAFIATHELPISSKGPQIKCSFGKVKSDADNLEQLDQSWKDQKMDEIRSYCTTFAEIYTLDFDKWQSLEDIKKYIPQGVFKKSNYSKKGYYQKSFKNYEYFLYVNDYQEETDKLNSVDIDNVKKLILHQRQVKLLKKYKEDLYSTTINEKQIKFYLN